MERKTENIVEYRRRYYEQNKERIVMMKKQLTQCPVCLKDISKSYWSQHQKTKKHIAKEKQALDLYDRLRQEYEENRDNPNFEQEFLDRERERRNNTI